MELKLAVFLILQDDEHDESGIDYSSLGGLMAALNTHGPTVVEDETEADDQQENNHNDQNGVEEEISSGLSSQTADIYQQV